jgi:hypothetical protein
MDETQIIEEANAGFVMQRPRNEAVRLRCAPALKLRRQRKLQRKRKHLRIGLYAHPSIAQMPRELSPAGLSAAPSA